MVTATAPKVHMGTITGGEARELYPANPVVLLPMGSHEDQGPHAPMGDYLLAEKIAELAAIRASESGTRTVVAPVIPYGAADHFGSMVGGIALSEAALTGVHRRDRREPTPSSSDEDHRHQRPWRQCGPDRDGAARGASAHRHGDPEPVSLADRLRPAAGDRGRGEGGRGVGPWGGPVDLDRHARCFRSCCGSTCCRRRRR